MVPVPGFSSASTGKGLPIPLPLVLILGALAIGTLVYILAPSLFKSAQSIDGTLILYTPEPWTSPNGEYVQGLISYEPATGVAVELYHPTAPFGRYLLPETLSPDGDRVLGVALSSLEAGAGPVLGAISISLQGTAATYAGYTEGVFVSPVWAPDGGRVAFAIRGSKEGLGPHLHIAPLFDDQPEYGEGTPLSFSNDGLSLLVKENIALIIMDTITGERRPVLGMEDASAFENFFTYPGAISFAALDAEGTLSFFSLDWDAMSATDAGQFPDVSTDAQVTFNKSGDALVLADGTAHIFRFENGAFIPRGRVTLPLPSDVRLSGWRSE